MRYVRFAILAALGVALIIVALANRDTVTLHLLPGELSGFLGFSWQVSLPLFIVILLGVVAGILVGFVWEWIRESKLRSEGKRARRAAVDLAREVKSLKGAQAKPGDEVLALLDQPK